MNPVEIDTCKLLDLHTFDCSSRFILFLLRTAARIIRTRAFIFKDKARKIQFENTALELERRAIFLQSTWYE